MQLKTNFRNENYNMYRNIISERITQNTDMDESEIQMTEVRISVVE